jgi:hypothetical protein
MLRLPAFACLIVTAVSLTPALKLRHNHVQRASTLCAQLATGWVTGVDDTSGQTYYYNEQTGASQWEPPLVASQVVWVLAPFEGVHPEYVLREGDTQVIGRSDMIKPNIYVSRAQCRIHVAADGTASVTSLGKAQTYVMKMSKKTSVNLAKDKPHVLNEGDQIALNIGANRGIFTVYALQSAAAQSYGYSQLPPGWVTGIDEASGHTYYYNEHTGHSQWEPPL